jgi:hypothetical protein
MPGRRPWPSSPDRAAQRTARGLPSLAAVQPGRVKVNPATEAITGRCAALYGQETLDFGRVLGGEAGYYPQEVLLCEGAKPAELFHLRIT